MTEQQAFEMFDLVGDRRRVLEGNSAFGYTPQSALADVIDNAIAANANVIRIDIVKKVGNAVQVSISDDGDGMSPERLKQAMAFGASKELINSGLSKFGFGMKTASMEISKSGFTVFSRDTDGAESMASILLDDQEGSGHIQARFYEGEQVDPQFRAFLAKTSTNDSGTVIIWHDANLKEADHFKVEKGTRDDMLRRVQNRIIPHLGMVFHRWISGTNSDGRKVKIIYGKEVVEAWDPFNPEWLDAEKTAPIDDLVIEGHSEQAISFKAHVLEKGIPKDHPAKKNSETQGIYVYRMDRVISGPDWFGLLQTGKRNPLNGLRFMIDVPVELDELMMLDVKKSSVDFPQELVDYLEPIVGRYARIEEDDFDSKRKRGNKKKTPEEALRRVQDATKSLNKKDPFVSPERLSDTEVLTTSEDGQRFPLKSRLNPNTDGKNVIQLVDAHQTQGFLWEPTTTASGVLVVKVNQEHEFYQKVILPATPEAQAGILQLLVAFSRAEYRTHHSDFKMQWVHARQHASQTLDFYAEDLELPAMGDDEE